MMADAATTTRRLVLIDDSELVLAVMVPVLTDAGFEVRGVSSLRKFVNVVLDWKPHLIVTDLYMPEMSGAELCSWLRQINKDAGAPRRRGPPDPGIASGRAFFGCGIHVESATVERPWRAGGCLRA